MGAKSPYLLPLATLPQGVFERDWVCGTEFFADVHGSADDIRNADVNVHLDGLHKGEQYILTFSLHGRVTVGCDRCLDDLELPIDAEYSIKMHYGEEHDESDDNVTVLAPQETTIDLAPLIRDTIMLALPLRKVHAPGECNAEMEKYISTEPADSDLEEGAEDSSGEQE